MGKEDILITGIEFFPGGDSALGVGYIILVATPTQLHQFIGYVPGSEEKPHLVHIFNKYNDVPGKEI